LAERWSLALPTAIAGAVSAALVFFGIGAVILTAIGALLVGGVAAGVSTLATGAVTVLIALVLIVIMSWLAHAVVVAAAHDAWTGGEPDFGAATRLVLARLPALLVAFVVIGALAIVPFALCFVLIGIPLLAVLGYLLMYVTPAIVIGGEDGLSAIRTSFRMTASGGPSIVGYLGILAAFVIGRIADTMFVHLPLIGLIAAFIIGGATAAYGALVSVRFYDLLRGVPGDVLEPVALMSGTPPPDPA
jgi:hypothetical protein